MTTFPSEILNGRAKCKLEGKDYHLKKGLFAEGPEL